MKSVKILVIIAVFLVCGCIDGKQNVAEIRYVCTDGMVAEHQSECRTPQEKVCPAAAATVIKYVCPDSALVGNPSDCKAPDATCQNETVCVCPGDSEGAAQNRSLETKSVCPECVCPKTECNFTCPETECVCPKCLDCPGCPEQTCDPCHSGSGGSVEITDLSLTDEWVEIKNNGNSAVGMVGWTLEDAAATPHVYTFPEFSLKPGTSVKVHTGEGENNEVDLYWGRSDVWNNPPAGDTATLKTPNGDVVSKMQKP